MIASMIVYICLGKLGDDKTSEETSTREERSRKVQEAGKKRTRKKHWSEHGWIN